MKKILLQLLAIILLFSMTGCSMQLFDDQPLIMLNKNGTFGKDKDVSFAEPPALEVEYDGGKLTANLGTYSWMYQINAEEWTGVCADSAHPLQCEAQTEAATAFDTRAVLRFADAPDQLTVQCWPDSKWGYPQASGRAVSVSEMQLELKPGGYIYEIAATWNDDGGPHYGTAYYFFYMVLDDHTHQPALIPQTVDDPITGYCGNTQTTLYLKDGSFTFMSGESVTMTDILANLDYREGMFCRCPAEYKADTEFGLGYEINLTQGFARCEKGQADLTAEQLRQIGDIIAWAEQVMEGSQ